MVRTRLLAILLPAVLLAGCGGSSAPNTGATPRGDRYVITAAELQAHQSNNLLDAIQQLRPEFLRQRGNNLSAVNVPSGGDPAQQSSSVGTARAGAPVPVQAYLDDQRLTSPEELRQITLKSVLEVRFIPGPQAGVRYGTNHAGGVILVKTKQ